MDTLLIEWGKFSLYFVIFFGLILLGTLRYAFRRYLQTLDSKLKEEKPFRESIGIPSVDTWTPFVYVKSKDIDLEPTFIPISEKGEQLLKRIRIYKQALSALGLGLLFFLLYKFSSPILILVTIIVFLSSKYGFFFVFKKYSYIYNIHTKELRQPDSTYYG